MPRSLGEGVSRDLKGDLNEWMPITPSLEEEDEAKMEASLKSSKGRNKKNKTGYNEKEAVSGEMSPEQALLAVEEAARSGEVLPDDVKEVVGPSEEEDISSLDDSLEDASFDDGLPEITTLEKPKSTVAFKDEPKLVGVRRAAANGKLRRIDTRNAEKGISAKELGQTHRDLEAVAGYEIQDRMDKHETEVYLKNLDKDGYPPARIEGKTLLQRIKRMFGGK